MEQKIVVIYHRADFDGIFCREIAKKFLPNAVLIGWDYGDPVPDPTVVSADDRLYMLDISIDGLMGHLNLIWIDHHKSAIEKFGNNIAGYRIDGVAACRLAWQWFAKHAELFHPTAGSFSVPLPEKQAYIDRTVSEPLAVRLAGEYDIWDKRDPRADLFQHGLRSQNLDLMWSLLLWVSEKVSIKEIEEAIGVGHPLDLLPDGTADKSKPWVEALLRQGEAIQYNATQQNESIIKAAGFTIEFEGLKFLACNHARYNSHLFTAGLKPQHDGCFGFAWRDGKWNVSLYHAPGKEHHDLSLIASKYGGGGHRGACGFRIEKLPFLT